MEAGEVAILRELLATSGWLERTGAFARRLRRSSRPGCLLVMGPPEEEEPWHLAAHLRTESDVNNAPELAPVLLRWTVPEAAPAHLSVGMDRLAEAGSGDAVFVVSEQDSPAPLLERLNDARHRRATVLALNTGDRELAGLAHEALSIPAGDRLLTFDAAQHLVSGAAGAPSGPRGVRDRLAGILSAITGPTMDR